MQLKEPATPPAANGTVAEIAPTLAAATCLLLGGAAAPPVEAQEQLAPWDIDTAMLVYSESDGRVRDLSLNAIGRKELREESFLNLTLAIDTLTGASPSGAVPGLVPQTFTRPSGNGDYTVTPGQLPLDDSFQDTRVALGASWEWPLTRLLLMNVGASFSDEYDYTHTGVNARLSRDFNQRNTTLSFGVALASDTIDAVGGSPTPLSAMSPVGSPLADRTMSRSKDVTDVLIGVTQVLNRHTLLQVNYSVSQSDGYLTDPYKLLSVVDPVTGALAPSAAGGLNRYLYESRPETRDKQSVYALIKRDIRGDVLDASYRYMTDDWGIDSHTFEVRYRWSLDGGRYWQPHVRFYSQTAADFYRTVLFDGAPLPAYASADYRLAEFNGVTVGLKYGKATQRGEFSTRLELYRQTGQASAGAAVGVLSGLDLYPDMTAVIAQFGYKFGR